MAKHLPEHGWRPIVVRAAPEQYTELPDPALAALVPASLYQVETGALPAHLTRLVGVRDIGIRAYSHLAHAIDALIDNEQPDIVFLTGGPFYPLLLSGRVRQRGVPVIVDLQDPWVSAQGAQARPLSKRRMAHRLAKYLEPRALNPASAVTTVSDGHITELKTRYPFLAERSMRAIPIGGDPEDFAALRDNPPADPQVRLPAGYVHINYVGAFLPRSVDVAKALFLALRRLAETLPQLAERLRLNFIGTSNQPAEAVRPLVTPLAEAAGVGALITEHPRRVPFLEALSLLANADGLLMIGSDEPHYTASKIYPGLMSGRPYVSVFHKASSAHRILSAAGGGAAFSFASAEELAALEFPLAEALATLAETPERFGRAEPSAYAPYTAHAIAGDYAQLFDKVVA